jgi:2-polyprenyl-3-methyl-5-hydroxy-6-metoxy-1,4-benzoquinol methylase
MFDLARQREAYPEFMKMVDLVAEQNLLQRKRIHDFISQQENSYWIFAEELSKALNYSLLKTGQERNEAARAYNHLCMNLLREQIRFRKSGVYRLNDARLAEETIYNQPGIMRHYIVGLLFSYIFWPNHYQMFCFFKDHLTSRNIGRCLEVGGGHGLFTAEILRRFHDLSFTLIDISQASIELTQDMLRAFRLEPLRVQYIHGDYLSVPLDTEGYDFIVMGEVLEHVNDAQGFLCRARRLLKSDGTLFLSTCANCPAPDHIYHFHNVREIRGLIHSAGLSIVKDEALPVDPVPEVRWEKELVSVNYCAILTHK